MSAHFDRILCPTCGKRFADINRVRQHMKRKGHGKMIGTEANRERKRMVKELRRYDAERREKANA